MFNELHQRKINHWSSHSVFDDESIGCIFDCGDWPGGPLSGHLPCKERQGASKWLGFQPFHLGCLEDSPFVEPCDRRSKQLSINDFNSYEHPWCNGNQSNWSLSNIPGVKESTIVGIPRGNFTLQLSHDLQPSHPLKELYHSWLRWKDVHQDPVGWLNRWSVPGISKSNSCQTSWHKLRINKQPPV